ncbi:hypothetical protein V6N11_018764 [Hibiscus sabdariffa]|uniref:PB1-like domain-containing protein n=1 Tax=Hibiscus sabdariffa TaxID=183260 RepID=A0ABR2QT10_9ROSI
MFTCVIRYGGDFVLSPSMKYTSKSIAYFDFVDVNTFSTFTLRDLIEKLGVVGSFVVCWRLPNVALSTASIRPLKNDHDYHEEEDYEDEVEVEVYEEEEEEVDVVVTKEEVDVAKEEEYEDVDEFDVCDHAYDWGGDEECRQEYGIRVRV